MRGGVCVKGVGLALRVDASESSSLESLDSLDEDEDDEEETEAAFLVWSDTRVDETESGGGGWRECEGDAEGDMDCSRWSRWTAERVRGIV